MAGLTKKEPKNIFCLETDSWYDQDSTHTVEPTLRLLERVSRTRYERHTVATEGEFEYCIGKFLQYKAVDFPILYLGFHGWHANENFEDSHIELNDGTYITLPKIQDLLRGKCNRRLVHFGSCGVLDTHGRKLNKFLNETEALAILGYTEAVDWMECAAFDILALNCLQTIVWQPKNILEIEGQLKETAPGLMKRLGFRLKTKTK